MDAPLELIVAVFDDEAQAGTVWREVKRAIPEGDVRVLNAATLIKNREGQTQIRESEDVDTARGALFGAITGGLIGLLGGPLGVAAGAAAGGLTGGVTANIVDMGFSDDQLNQLKDMMQPGSSALILLLEHRWVEEMTRELERYQSRMLSGRVNPETRMRE